MNTQSLPSPVRHEHVPNWLRRRMLKVTGTTHGITTGHFVLEHAIWKLTGYCSAYPWLDHWGSTRLPNGVVAFVSKPYGLSVQSLQAALQFAYALGLHLHVSGFSEWNPSGGTIRILMTPMETEP